MPDWSKTSKPAFNRVTNADGSPIRDKDNAHPQLKPKRPHRPQLSLAPMGAKGIRPKPANDLVPKLSDQMKSEVKKIVFRKTRRDGGMER